MKRWLLVSMLGFGCRGDAPEATDTPSDTGPTVFVAQVVNPDERCRRDEEVAPPPGGGCDDVVVVTMSSDGTCWRFSCSWEDLPFEQGTGGSGPPADANWCADSEWFAAQPACDTDSP